MEAGRRDTLLPYWTLCLYGLESHIPRVWCDILVLECMIEEAIRNNSGIPLLDNGCEGFSIVFRCLLKLARLHALPADAKLVGVSVNGWNKGAKPMKAHNPKFT